MTVSEALLNCISAACRSPVSVFILSDSESCPSILSEISVVNFVAISLTASKNEFLFLVFSPFKLLIPVNVCALLYIVVTVAVLYPTVINATVPSSGDVSTSSTVIVSVPVSGE